VTVACEPTGQRWRILGQLAGDCGMSFVCVQPMLSSWARKTEDLTADKTDDKDAVITARLTDGAVVDVRDLITREPCSWPRRAR
jgi:hypothetical protein